MGSDPDRVSGHVNVRKGKRGDVFYVKYRPSDGRQMQHRLEPAWTKAGRPPQGFYTRRTAELALAAILTDARRGRLADMRRIEAAFADAAAESLCYVERVHRREPSTVRRRAWRKDHPNGRVCYPGRRPRSCRGTGPGVLNRVEMR